MSLYRGTQMFPLGGEKERLQVNFKKSNAISNSILEAMGFPDQHNLEMMGFQENNILINFQLDIEASNLRDAFSTSEMDAGLTRVETERS